MCRYVESSLDIQQVDKTDLEPGQEGGKNGQEVDNTDQEGDKTDQEVNPQGKETDQDGDISLG